MSMMKNNGFDERQILARGKGFQIGYILSILMIFLNSVLEESPADMTIYSRTMFCIWIPMIVVLTYFILNDAYERINEISGRIMMCIFVIVGLFIVAVTVYRIFSGAIILVENGVVGDAAGQLMCGVFLLVISGVYFAKKFLNKKNIDSEEE